MCMKSIAGNSLLCAASAAVICAAAFSSSAATTYADWNLAADTALTDDVTVTGTLTIPSGVTLNLNGHTLSVAAIMGSGSIATPPKYLDENREYIALEFIETSGKQYFDTGVRANTTTDAIKADCIIVPLAKDKSAQVILGAGKSVTNGRNDMVLYLDSNEKWCINHGLNSKAAVSSVTYATDTEYAVSALWKSDDTYIAVDGRAVATRSSPTTFDAGINLYAFARNNNGTPDLYDYMFIRCGVMTISQPEDVPLRRFVPAKRSGIAGMYDTLGKKFYPSATADPFIAGPELADDDASGSVIRLLGDIDFTALDVDLKGVAPSFDANGYRLTVPSSVIGSRMTIGSSLPGGVLEVDVMSGETAETKNVELYGSLKLVKKGRGTLVANRAGQTYTGGTLIECGTLKCGLNGDVQPFGPEWGSAGENLVRNGDFEQSSIISGDYGYLVDGATTQYWECSDKCGITKPGTVWTSITSGLGSYAMFLQYANSVWQDIEISTPGIYSFSFNDVARGGSKGSNLMNLLLIDVANCMTNTILQHVPGSASVYSRYGIVYVPSAGTYRLMVKQTDNEDKSNVYDNFKFALLSDTEQGKITVGPGGSFELDGKYGFNKYRFVLNGGTMINNTGKDVSDGVVNIVNVRLEADSTFCATNNVGLVAPCNYGPTVLDLNSHTLTVKTAANKYFWLYNTTVVNGTLNDNPSGWLKIDKHNGIRAIETDLVGGGAMDVQVDCAVRDYTATYSGNWTVGAGLVKVTRTFKPKVDRYHGVAMQNGSTLDLTEWPVAAGWPMSSRFSSGGGVQDVTFATGTADRPTVVTVRLDTNRADVMALAASRMDGTHNGYLLKWDVKPDGIVFSLDEESASKYRLVANSTGLLLRLRIGFMVVVQ